MLQYGRLESQKVVFWLASHQLACAGMALDSWDETASFEVPLLELVKGGITSPPLCRLIPPFHSLA